MSEAVRSHHWGLLALLIKLGPKLGPVLLKIGKGLLDFKTLGALASVGFYSYLLTWQMGVALVAFLLVHEYGHLWAMQKCGLKTKGIYLIPGFGGVAVAAEKFRSGRNEAYIAIMGPVFGFFFAVPLVALYFYTGNVLFMAITSFVLFINLVNLLPINPLDGGRIVKALVYSVHQSLGFIVMLVSFVAAMILGFHYNIGLLAVIAMAGLYEVLNDYGLKDALDRAWVTALRIAGGGLLYIFGPSTYNKLAGPDPLNALDVFGIIVGVVTCGIIAIAFLVDAVKRSPRWSVLAYPFVVIRDAWVGLTELCSLKASDLERIDGHKQMTRGQLVFYTLAFIVTAFVHVVAMVYAARLADFKLVTDLLE